MQDYLHELKEIYNLCLPGFSLVGVEGLGFGVSGLGFRVFLLVGVWGTSGVRARRAFGLIGCLDVRISDSKPYTQK